jgi:hypothetical protein
VLVDGAVTRRLDDARVEWVDVEQGTLSVRRSPSDSHAFGDASTVMDRGQVERNV